MNFEPLREMEAFSNEMFTRIVSVQQKEHPAWNTALPFAERIKGVPLFNLIFSSPDRNAVTTGPTISHYYPLRAEMRKIAHYARQVAAQGRASVAGGRMPEATAGQPTVCDLRCGNGFIGSLLANEGVRVIGVREPTAKPNQIPDFYDFLRYEMRTLPITDIDFAFDVAFSSWMPSEVNDTPHILQHSPKLIIYIHTDHVDGSSGRRQTGTAEAFVDLPGRYKLVDQWSVTRAQDMQHDVWSELPPSIEETRHVKVYADTPFHGINLLGYAETAKGYDWENDLEMTLLALEAQATLRARGIAF